MVQQAVQNDPRFRNNSQLRQGMDMLSSNPAMAQQMSQMMNNPGVLDRMRRMMRQQSSGSVNSTGVGSPGGLNDDAMQQQLRVLQGMMGNVPHQQAVGGGATTGASGASRDSGSSNLRDGDSSAAPDQDGEMTEEEMIAEAIARSLRET